MKKKLGKGFLYSVLFFCASVLLAEEQKDNETCNWPKEWRSKALMRLDDVLSKAIPYGSRTCALLLPLQKKQKKWNLVSLDAFEDKHGYFSCTAPLVGLVTQGEGDVIAVEKAFSSFVPSKDIVVSQVAVGEVLTKALAYRNLDKGMVLQIPTLIQKELRFVAYKVDEVLDLWLGMPAFGLIPVQDKKASPILLFRGTDFSFLSKRGWASILSDLDVSGIGFSVFESARPKIREWLAKAKKEQGKPAVVMGFSLGGVLSLYTVLFEGNLIAEKGSMAFNSPGVSQVLFEQWEKKKSSQLVLYQTKGDLISKLGKLIFQAFELSDNEHLGPIQAHTKLMTALSDLSIQEIDISAENKSRFTME